MKKYYKITAVVLAVIITAIATKSLISAFNFDVASTTAIKAKVTKITSDEKQSFDSANGVYFETVKFNAKYISGGAVDSKDEELSCFQSISSVDATANKKVTVGDTVYVHQNSENVNLTARYEFDDFARTGSLLILLIITLITAVLVLGIVGLKKSAYPVFSILIATEILLTAFASAKYTVLLSILAILIIVSVNVFSKFRLSSDSVISAVGCLASILITYCLFAVFYGHLNLTGSFNPLMLSVTETAVKNGDSLAYKGLLACAVLFSAVGGALYVSNFVTDSLRKNLKTADGSDINIFKSFCKAITPIRKKFGGIFLFIIPALISLYMSNIANIKNTATNLDLFLNHEGFAVTAITVLLTVFCILISAPITAILGTLFRKYLGNFKKSRNN